MTTLTTYRPSLLGHGVFNEIFDSMLDFPQLMQRTTQGYPVADIYREDNGDTVMEFALAGFRKEDLSIEIKPEKKSITVSANSENITATERKRRVARRNFSKTYINYDSNLDLNAVAAEFENGLLRLVLPQRAEAKPLVVKIG
jgi:HSP20 family molecular chaperone IbpA